MKEFFNSLFGASSKEIKGLLLVISVLIIGVVTPQIIKLFRTEDFSYQERDKQTLDSLVEQLDALKNTIDTVELTAFDPNLANAERLESLGFSGVVANRIVNYRNKGGSFKVKKDLLKIYGIDSGFVDGLLPYILLPETTISQSLPHPASQAMNIVKVDSAQKRIVAVLPDFDINRADTSMLQTIKGIGTVLSKRIIDFRDKLGGYINLAQLNEVYNLDSIVIGRLMDKVFIEQNFQPKKISINRCTEEQLAGHPYISWQQARLIIAYRNQHGDYVDGNDLLKVYGIDKDVVEKISPYLDWSLTN